MKDERVADGRRGEEGKQSKKGGDEERERGALPSYYSILILLPQERDKKGYILAFSTVQGEPNGLWYVVQGVSSASALIFVGLGFVTCIYAYIAALSIHLPQPKNSSLLHLADIKLYSQLICVCISFAFVCI